MNNVPYKDNDFITFLKGKEAYYKWMSDMFLFSPGKEQAEAYCGMLDYMKTASGNAKDDNSSIISQMEQVVKKYKSLTPDGMPDYMTELNRNYTYIFCMGKFTPVTESAYISSGGLNNEADLDEIEGMYAQSGYKADTRGSNEPLDHIGIELGFLADMNKKCGFFLKRGNTDEFIKGLVIQRVFFEKHLLTWIADFCANVKSRQEVTTYYHPLMLMLERFVKEDYEFVSEILNNYAS